MHPNFISPVITKAINEPLAILYKVLAQKAYQKENRSP